MAGYEKFWDIISVEKTLYNSAERRGMEKGMAEGMEKGMEKGIEKGIEKGMAEERHLIALNMKKQGVSFDLISQCTGLSIKEIELL